MKDKPGAKVCNTCRKKKPLTQFRRNVKYSDGHVGKCDECLAKRRTEIKAQKEVYAEQYFDPKSQPF
jgi:hypothetical protein